MARFSFIFPVRMTWPHLSISASGRLSVSAFSDAAKATIEPYLGKVLALLRSARRPSLSNFSNTAFSFCAGLPLTFSQDRASCFLLGALDQVIIKSRQLAFSKINEVH